MARRPWVWLTCAVVLTTWLPYLFGWWLTPPGMRYFWLIYNPDDQNVHLMWARQAMEGAWHFHDLYTTEPHPGLFVNLFSLALGWFCRWTGISLHLGYQLFRTLAAVAFLWTVHWFGTLFLKDERGHLLFLLLVAFSSGFGWVLVLWWWVTGQRPPVFLLDVSPELMMPEANSFLSLTVAPLATLGATLAMGALGNWWLALKPNCLARKRRLKLALLFGLLVVNVHTYAAIPMLIAVALWQGGNLRQWRHTLPTTLGFLVPSALVLFCQALVFSCDRAFAQKAATPTLTPNPVILIGSYGFVALGALLALPKIWQERRGGAKEWELPMAWLVAILIAIYLPVRFQRKMIEGLHVVLCLLATVWLAPHLGRFRCEHFRWALVGLVMLTVPSQIAFFALNGYWLVHNNLIYDERFNPPYSRRLMPPYYLSEHHLQLFRWLERHSDRQDGVLCHPMLGNYLPVLTGRKVFVGHWAETLNFPAKLRLATAVWEGSLPVELARQLFRTHQLHFALETEFERAAAQGTTALARYGKVVFQVGNNRVFRLRW